MHARTRRRSGPALLIMITLVALVGALFLTPPAPAEAAVPSGLKVSGNRLVNSRGEPVVLHGVNRSGTEYKCIQGGGIFDGPSDAASITAMASWKINAVRVPLNETCWLGTSQSPAAPYSGQVYRDAITAYVARLHDAGLIAIVELHWNAPGSNLATGQQNMPDADNAPAFWRSVASTFKSDSSTVFDLYNEPHDVSWTCWRDGGDCGIGFAVAGMASLVRAVRGTGATNPIMLGGLAYANDLSQWNTYKPNDSNLMASWHSYNFNACKDSGCWDSQLGPVAATVPLVAGEIGENDCAHGYIDAVMNWLDSRQSGYLGWAWVTYDCSQFPSLISNYDGTPTNYGIGLRDRFARLATGSPTPTATSTATSTPTTSPSTTPPSPGGLVGATGRTGSAPWWWEDHLDVRFPGTVSAVSITVTVPAAKASGLSSYGLWTNGPGGALSLDRTTRDSSLVYTVALNKGVTLASGFTLEVGAQFSGNGTPHDVRTDSYVMTATIGGQHVVTKGTFTPDRP